MKMKSMFLTLLTVALTAATANAALVVSGESTIDLGLDVMVDELYYAGGVSSSDLLDGIAGIHTGWDPLALGAGLNDGLAGGDADAGGTPLVGTAFALNTGTSSEFVLGAGDGYGYDITEIQSIAAWTSAGLNNQHYTISVRYLGDTAYTVLTTVDYQPFTVGTNEDGSSKVVVTDDTGILVSGIDAIRFDILATDGHETYATLFREIDVMGAAAIPEPATLVLLGLGSLLTMRRRR